jgi:hypothetical protein
MLICQINLGHVLIRILPPVNYLKHLLTILMSLENDKI